MTVLAQATGSAATFQAVAGGIGSLVTAAGVVVGGVWAYRKFIRQRQGKPKCLISHEVSHRRMTDGRIALNVDVVLANHGDALIEIQRAYLLIKQISPLPAYLLADLETDAEMNEWPVIATSASLGTKPFSLLEPGEEAVTHVDFVLNAFVSSVAVYTYCQDRTQVGSNLGWERTTIHDIALPLVRTEKAAPDEQQATAAEVRPSSADQATFARQPTRQVGADD